MPPGAGHDRGARSREAFADWRRPACAARRRRRERPCASASVKPPVPLSRAVLAIATGEATSLAAARSCVEGDWSGLYDVFTAEAARGRGLAARAMPPSARAAAARRARVSAYLQVDAANDAGAQDLSPPRLRRRLRVPLPNAGRAPPERPQALGRGPVASSRPRWTFMTAPRRRSRPCRGCRGAHIRIAWVALANTNSSTRLVSLHACTSK